jgi:ligand-binding sensor domain-containing protein/serine phosphatase RsbU (regulator of sigma subunit)
MSGNCERSGRTRRRWSRYAGGAGVVAILALASSVIAQPSGGADAPDAGGTEKVAVPAKSVRRIPAPLQCDRLTLADGLPISHVTSFAQDKSGFIWIGTPQGLVRYDGIRMKAYKPNDKDPTSISSPQVVALAPDVSGKLWVGTNDQGINLYDPATNKFTRYLSSPNASGMPSSDGVIAILRDKKDRVWFAMGGGGLNRFDPATGKFVDYSADALNVPITSLATDAGGDLWLATSEDGVIRWNPDTNAVTKFDLEKLGIESKINDIAVASTGKVWIATELEGAVILDPTTGKSQYLTHSENPTTIGNDSVTKIIEASNKSMWVGTRFGLNRIDEKGAVTRFDPDPNDPSTLAFPEVLAAYQDQGGVLWFGGFTVGVCKVNEAKLQFGYHRTRNGSYATSFTEDAKGVLWVGTYNDGLYRYDPETQEETVYNRLERREDGQPGTIDLTKDTWQNALHRAKDGTIWIGIRSTGLVGFNPKTETYRDYRYDKAKPNGIPWHTIFDIWEDASGKLWLAMWDDGSPGLVRFDPKTDEFTQFREADNIGLTANSYFQIYSDPSDSTILWLATDGGGLVRFDSARGAATSFRHKADDPNTLGSDTILSIVKAGDGTLWLGTRNGGLNHLDPTSGKVERFTTSNSKLTNDTIQGLLQDNAGDLWLGTDGGGLVRFVPKDKSFYVYTHNDGAQDEFNQCAFMKTSSGKLLFGGLAGWNGFEPTAITRDEYKPPVVITAFRLGNQEIDLEKPIWTLPTLQLSYTDSFEIQFAALAFAAPKENRYAYKLEPYDDKFIETDRPFATYAKLPGGKYTLRVRASNRHGVWNEAGVMINLKVTPPIWRTIPAFIVYMLLLVGAVLAMIRFQRERLKKAEREGRLALVERDLALTGAVQTSFLPDQNEIVSNKLQLIGLYRPADACGGDWWWHERLADNRHLVMVGDVTGHGPGPAMVTAAVATAFRVLLESGIEDVGAVLAALNREVLRVGKSRYHMTMATLEIFEHEGRWVLHSAGGPPILALNAKGKHRVVFCPGTPLGTENGFEIGRVEGRFKPSDRMLLYTDGIPEIMLPGGNALGMRRFAHIYEGTRNHHLREAAHFIMQEADRTQGNQPQADDWTFTLLEWIDNDGSVVTTTQSLTSLT